MIIIDPISKESIPLVALAESLYAHSAPLRIGFVFFTNSDEKNTKEIDARVAANNAFHYLMETQNPKEAMDFLSSVSIKNLSANFYFSKFYS